MNTKTEPTASWIPRDETWRPIINDIDIEIVNASNWCVARIPLTGIKKNDERDAANSRLIASAPELLGALKAALTRLSPTIDAEVITQARAAVAKATGRVA